MRKLSKYTHPLGDQPLTYSPKSPLLAEASKPTLTLIRHKNYGLTKFKKNKAIRNGWHFSILCYTMCIVRSKKMRKVRVAKDMFVKDSPFKPRVVRSKKEYSRKLKHKASK